ncbi:MAG TPA: ribokinase [Capillibacterium sp.]
MSEIVVVGSMNMDFVVSVERYPQRGETIIGKEFLMSPGGKGANQAATIGNLGGDVTFLAACGKDIFGDQLLTNLKSFGVNVEHVIRCEDTPTGIASITLESKGENRIVVIPGANHRLSVSNIERLAEEIKKAKVVLLQLEIPLETVLRTIEIAYEHNIQVVLDPAPARKLPEEIYAKIDYILPNEGEITQLCAGYNLITEKERINKLLALGVGGILITKGEQGVTYYSTEQTITQPAIQTKVVDTTGAGDIFAGAFVFGLQKGWALEDSIKFATCAAGLSVARQGAQSSIPTFTEVKEALQVMDPSSYQKLFCA